MQFDDLILTYSKYRMYCRKVKSKNFFSYIYNKVSHFKKSHYFEKRKEKRKN